MHDFAIAESDTMGLSRLALLFFVSAAVLANVVIPSIAGVENREAVDIDGKRYLITHELSFDWNDAVQTCNAANNSTLASFETLAENNLLKEYIEANLSSFRTTKFWTSGHRISGGWMWFGSGHLLSESNLDWAAGEPNGTGTNACISFQASSGWFAENCSLQKNFICE